VHAHILRREGDWHIGREDGFWPEPLYSLGGSESDQKRAWRSPDLRSASCLQTHYVLRAMTRNRWPLTFTGVPLSIVVCRARSASS
jgi:hypothetical protein